MIAYIAENWLMLSIGVMIGLLVAGLCFTARSGDEP